MSLVRNSATIGSLTLFSKILGFARDMLGAHYLGAGMANDCYLIAARLPNMFRSLFAEGAFSAAFVPMFSKELVANGGDTKAGIRFAEDALAVLLPILLVFTALMQFLAPQIVMLMTGGFQNADPQKFHLAVVLTQITFPYLLFISLVSLQGGVLNSLGRFSAAAAAPVLLNITLITGLLVFHSHDKVATAHAQSIAITVSGVAQLIWLAWACHKAGINLHLRMPRLTPKVRELLKVIGPAAVGAGANQLNLFVSTSLVARYLVEGSVSWFYNATQISQLPLGLVGVGIGTALLPTLTRAVSSGNTQLAQHTQNRAVELGLIFILPATAALLAIGEPLVRLLLRHGAFTRHDSMATGPVLAALALGLPAYVLVKVLIPGFYARGDTKTPVRISMFSILINLLGNITTIFATDLHLVGIALATAVSAWVNVIWLYAVLHRHNHFRLDARALRNGAKLLAASCVMALVLLLFEHQIDPLLNGNVLQRLISFVLIMLVAALSYFGIAFMLRALTWQDLKAQFFRKKV